jgi:hypothetical protein
VGVGVEVGVEVGVGVEIDPMYFFFSIFFISNILYI